MHVPIGLCMLYVYMHTRRYRKCSICMCMAASHCMSLYIDVYADKFVRIWLSIHDHYSMYSMYFYVYFVFCLRQCSHRHFNDPAQVGHRLHRMHRRWTSWSLEVEWPGHLKWSKFSCRIFLKIMERTLTYFPNSHLLRPIHFWKSMTRWKLATLYLTRHLQIPWGGIRWHKVA